MRLVVHAPREVMHAAHAPRAPARFRRVANVDDAGGSAEAEPGPAALGGELLEAEDRGQELIRRRRVAFPDLRAVQAADLLRSGYRTPVPGREGASRRRLNERHMQAVRIGERQHLLAEARLHWARLRPIALQTT